MIDFFNAFWEFVTVGFWAALSEFFTAAIVGFILWTIDAGIQAAHAMGEFITAQILELDVAAPIVTAIAQLPPDISGFLNILNFPTAMTIIVGAHATAISYKFVGRLAFLPGFFR